MQYMLVVPPEGDIEQLPFEGVNAAFAEMQRQASVVPGKSAHLELVRYLAIDGVEMYVDEDTRYLAADVPLNERASWLAKANTSGVAVLCGPGITGLSLDKALAVIKQLDGAV